MGFGLDFPGSNWGWHFVYEACCPQDEDLGCSRTQGFWKNHHRYATSPGLLYEWPIDEDTLLCDKTWLENLQTPPAGNAFYQLSHQFIAAMLNIANGAYVSVELAAAMVEAEELLEACEIASDDRARALELAEMSDRFDNGLLDAPHCDTL